MNRRLLRWTLLGLVGLVAISGLVPSVLSGLGVEVRIGESSTTQPSTVKPGWCEKSGVSVVVDFGVASGLEPEIKCVTGPKQTGWDVLAAAGLSPQGTSQYPTGFVCRLANFPPSNLQDCADTPNYSEGTWSYYFATAEAGNNWMFSGAGSAQRTPECGSVEGWVFEENHSDGLDQGPSVKPRAFNCK